MGLTTGAAAAVVGPDWLGQVRQAEAVGPPASPALARWLAAQAGVASDVVWTPGGAVVLGGNLVQQVPASEGTAAAWRLGTPAPETEPQVHVGPVPGAFDGKLYRGTLSATVSTAGVTVVNTLPLEEYLRGVVPAEAFASWPLAALQAQAVAARTFTLKNLGRRAAAGFDLYADTRDQAYGGIQVETAATDAAVFTTRGIVLTHDGQLIDAVYSANAGGYAASAEETWGTPVPYLISAPLPEEPDDHWAALLPAQPLLKAFPELGGSLAGAESGPVSASGRIRTIRLLGRRIVDAPVSAVAKAADPRGAVRSSRITTVSAAGGRTLVGSQWGPVRSFTTWGDGAPGQWTVIGAGSPVADVYVRTAVYIAGSGYGHGVGLSQWGAYALARQGWDFRKILARFYPGASLQVAKY